METKTPFEKNLDRLKGTNGVSLGKHPASVFVKNWLSILYRDDHRDYLDTGEQQRRYEQREIPKFLVEGLGVIMTIEELNAMLRETNAECDVSLKAIGIAYNKIKSTSEVIVPALHAITSDIRQSRMSTEAEMKETLKWLTTVREFFLENKYELEMKRLREFIDICKEIHALKQAGMLDAVAELAITLALQEKKKP
jgi:hypothetical protein